MNRNTESAAGCVVFMHGGPRCGRVVSADETGNLIIEDRNSRSVVALNSRYIAGAFNSDLQFIEIQAS